MQALAESSAPDVSAQAIWTQILETLRREGKTYALSWLTRMRPVALRDGEFILGVPDRFFRDWVDDHYRTLLEEMIVAVARKHLQIGYELIDEVAGVPLPAASPIVNGSSLSPHRLNQRFTFSSYVVADSNQLSAAGASAVAENPGRCYNPLFIYGGTGLGKTHLLHAVGNQICSNAPSSRVVYLSSEEFTNEFVESVRDHRMPNFRRKFREECDVLLIDDVQFLGKKEETQKEFFYTFNTLHERSKAIVLTSDSVPSEIPGLEERLRSRFTMGLITDIQEPNFETRVAILKKKAEGEGVQLSDRVCHYIARHIQRNVRELEGALIIDFVQRETARFYKLATEDLRQDRRTKHLVHARQVAMYLCRKLTKSSFPEIGVKFNKDHSTVISAVRKIENLRDTETSLHKEISELETKLGAPLSPDA